MPSLKNSKADILSAFEEMKQKYEEAKNQMSPAQLDLQKKEEENILAKTASYAPDALENDIAALRKKIQASLDELAVSLAEESKKLSEIKSAAAIESERLKTARQMELAAEALDILLTDYQTKEKELAAKQRATEETMAQEIARRKKDWEREQEEYAYNQKIARKKEEDGYEMEQGKKEALRKEALAKKEAETTERENILRAREEAIKKMEAEIAALPAKLEQAALNGKQQAEETMRKDFAVEKRLAEQEWRAEKNAYEAKIAGLQENAKAAAAEIKSLKDSLAASNQHAQTLAATVIEGMAGMKQMKTAEAAKE